MSDLIFMFSAPFIGLIPVWKAVLSIGSTIAMGKAMIQCNRGKRLAIPWQRYKQGLSGRIGHHGSPDPYSDMFVDPRDEWCVPHGDLLKRENW